MKLQKLLIGIVAALTMMLAAPALHAAAAPVLQADGTYFDAEYYADNNPDVVACFGRDANWMYLHYTLVGKAQGRLPYAPGALGESADDFDATYYATRYPDVASILGYDPALLKLHYDLYGMAEGRFPNAAAEAAATGTPATPAAPATSGVTISSLGERYAAIEATVTLSGTGTGYSAKILLQSGTSGSAMSFEIQYDAFARAPYTGRATYHVENVIHNGPGGQDNQWYGFAQLGVPTRMMMVLDTQTGIVDLYVNGEKVGSAGNTFLLQGMLCASVEGGVRLEGDTVNASITDIRFKKPGTAYTEGDSVFFWQCVSRNPALAVSYSGAPTGGWCTSSNFNVAGTAVGLGGLDWHTAYLNVSGTATYALWL